MHNVAETDARQIAAFSTSQILAVPVRAIGAVYFFRGGSRLSRGERAVYVAQRFRAEDSLACGQLFSAEVGRQKTASLRDDAEFWQSIETLTDMVNFNSSTSADRSAKLNHPVPRFLKNYLCFAPMSPIHFVYLFYIYIYNHQRHFLTYYTLLYP